MRAERVALGERVRLREYEYPDDIVEVEVGDADCDCDAVELTLELWDVESLLDDDAVWLRVRDCERETDDTCDGVRAAVRLGVLVLVLVCVRLRDGVTLGLE